MTDTQGLMRKKTEYRSIPYRSVSRWSVESKGGGLLDGADLKLWLSSQTEPFLEVELQRDESARELMAMLSRCAL